MKLVYALVPAVVLASAALAQAPQRGDEVYRYQGADRDARLVANARREGSVVLYTSLAPTESKPLADAFESPYIADLPVERALPAEMTYEARGARRER